MCSLTELENPIVGYFALTSLAHIVFLRHRLFPGVNRNIDNLSALLARQAT